jgi:hypothetical protein
VEKRLIALGEQPNGNASWQGHDQPDGAWTVRGPHGIIAWNRFDDARTGRSLVNWNAKSHPRVTLGVWSSPIQLKPGESFKTDATFGVAESWGAGPTVASAGKAR